MRRLCLAWAVLAGCNALTGASDLVVGGQPPDGDAGLDGAVDDERDAGSYASTPPDASDATFVDVRADVVPRPDGGKYVFTTSTTTNGAFGGLAQADTICAQAASAAGLGGGGWVAYLSSTSTGLDGSVSPGVNAIDRLAWSGPWYLVTGVLAVASRQAIAANSINHAIDRTELAAPVPNDPGVWTGTWKGEQYGGNCNGWSSTGGKGAAGDSTASAGDWSYKMNSECASDFHVYCFEN